MTFYDCLLECATNKELIFQFNRLSGCNLGPDNRTQLEKMIDAATGYDNELKQKQDDELYQFIEFVYDVIWLTFQNN